METSLLQPLRVLAICFMAMLFAASAKADLYVVVNAANPVKTTT